jgi:hypothetical protein
VGAVEASQEITGDVQSQQVVVRAELHLVTVAEVETHLIHLQQLLLRLPAAAE